ncbi:hypothetical protein VT84_37690 [Gemmata sp. SH-PL17]|uniref:hypothetical protein n=1 Tax=Gemmata sp. SH-PL17 TaxID=1630693 RepID=UPI00078B441F|nr:hypothetical protein [Gemmata sp. SH-PL17]AMV30186.1 hypothetical protein VT84_37690 [Gemmata sp. SH-PL17]
MLVSIIGAIGPLVAGIKIVVAAISAIGAGPLLAVAAVAAAIGGLAYLFRDELAEYAQAALDKVREILDDLSRVADQLKESWGGVVAAIGAGDMNLAMEIALTTLELLWAQATDAMTGKWNSFTNAVVDGWHEVTDGLGPILDALWEDLNRGADEVVSAFHAIGEQITEGITWVQDSIQALRDEFSDVADALTMLVAPIVAPFAVAADLIRQIWDGISSNVMENLINLVSWIDRMDVQISDKFTNTFNAVARTVLDAAIKITEILDKVDPTDSLKGRLDELRGLRGGLVDVTAAETQAKLDKINADRDKAIESLREQREKAQKARDEARAADAENAKNEVAQLQARVDALNAQARALQRPGAGAKAPDLKAGAGVAAVIAGSSGSFTAAAAGQRFGTDPLFKRQVKAAENTADNTAATAKAAEGIVKALQMK